MSSWKGQTALMDQDFENASVKESVAYCSLLFKYLLRLQLKSP